MSTTTDALYTRFHIYRILQVSIHPNFCYFSPKCYKYPISYTAYTSDYIKIFISKTFSW